MTAGSHQHRDASFSNGFVGHNQSESIVYKGTAVGGRRHRGISGSSSRPVGLSRQQQRLQGRWWLAHVGQADGAGTKIDSNSGNTGVASTRSGARSIRRPRVNENVVPAISFFNVIWGGGIINIGRVVTGTARSS